MSNYTYDNKVIENKYNSILNSLLDLNQFCTIKEITQGAGDTLRVVYHSASGDVDEVAMGEGNTNTIEVTGGYTDYVLKTLQAKGFYYDEEAQRDPAAIDAMLKGMAEAMTNKWNKDIMGEYDKAILNEVGGTINADAFADAIAFFGEDESGISALIHPKTKAALRKTLNNDLKYVEGFVRNGYIGSIYGVPVYTSKDVHEGEVILATKEAINVLLNKDNEVEPDRDKDHRKNIYYIRKVGQVALANDKKVARIAANPTTATTITTATKETKAVEGAADTGSIVKVYVNGKFAKEATAASNAYAVTLDDNLATGDVVVAVAKKDGQVSSKAEFTVA